MNMINNPGKLRKVVATTVCGALIAVAALSAAASDVPLTAKVAFADLDLAHSAGAEQLYGRIRRAASEVCAPLESLDPQLVNRWHTCVDEATARAVADVNQPGLVAVYTAKTGKSVAIRVASAKVG